jgi:hypothetical protein
MKKVDKSKTAKGQDEIEVDTLRPEYKREDFASLVRGKYAKRTQESSTIVVLDPDVAEVFPTSEAVNDTLRQLIELARKQVPS